MDHNQGRAQEARVSDVVEVQSALPFGAGARQAGLGVVTMPGEVEHGNGTQRADGIALTGAVTFDQDLYGGDDRAGYVGSIGVADDEQQDERERALARCGGRPLFWAAACCRVSVAAWAARWSGALTGRGPLLRSKLQSFTAPKSVMGDLPVEDESGEVRARDALCLPRRRSSRATRRLAAWLPKGVCRNDFHAHSGHLNRPGGTGLPAAGREDRRPRRRLPQAAAQPDHLAHPQRRLRHGRQDAGRLGPDICGRDAGAAARARARQHAEEHCGQAARGGGGAGHGQGQADQGLGPGRACAARARARARASARARACGCRRQAAQPLGPERRRRPVRGPARPWPRPVRRCACARFPGCPASTPPGGGLFLAASADAGWHSTRLLVGTALCETSFVGHPTAAA